MASFYVYYRLRGAHTAALRIGISRKESIFYERRKIRRRGSEMMDCLCKGVTRHVIN